MIASIQAKLAEAGKAVKRDRYHRYTVNGQIFPGVTSILGQLAKPALVFWAANVQQEADIETAWKMTTRMEAADWAGRADYERDFRIMAGQTKEHQKRLKEAGDLGTELHALIEYCLRTQMGETVEHPKASDKAMYVYAGFEEWAKDVDLTPIALESYVFSLVHRYAGALDCLALVNGILTLLDWKTGKAIYPEMRLQNIAYRVAFEEMTGHGAAGLLVRLPKDGEGDELAIEPHQVTDDVPTLFEVFKGIMPAHAWLAAQEKERKAK